MPRKRVGDLRFHDLRQGLGFADGVSYNRKIEQIIFAMKMWSRKGNSACDRTRLSEGAVRPELVLL